MSFKGSEFLEKIHRIEIRTNKLVNEVFGGRYQSTFKGRGMEFVDIREYVPGDDVRSIHWNVTARLGLPYVKRFTEERELTIILAVDVSRSHVFGTKGQLKSELAAELVALLAFACLRNNDKVGLLLFSDQVEGYIAPRKTKKHALRLVSDVLRFKPAHQGTNINKALEFLNKVQKKRAVVFLISDFIDENYEKLLSITQNHHDTVAMIIEDSMEVNWPKINSILLEDAESNSRMLYPKATKSFLSSFSLNINAQKNNRDRLFSKIKMDKIFFQTDRDYVRPLLQFFQQRERRFR
ncbi:MAG: DUF58 domain-containing protein [Elusimicrobiota bacterium]